MRAYVSYATEECFCGGAFIIADTEEEFNRLVDILAFTAADPEDIEAKIMYADRIDYPFPPDELCNRLLTREEIDRIDKAAETISKLVQRSCPG